ncbi:MAG: PKD domain-containing protein [Bacteroidales bacterium]
MTYVSPYELGLNAGFAADDTEVCTGASVNFIETSTGDPISWIWSFPNGNPSSYNGQNPPPVTYSSPGLYDVSLTVSDGVDNDTETKTGYISVKNIIADFSGTPTTVVKGNTVSFTDLSDCSPSSWTWSFPGGSPASFNGQNPPPILYDTEGMFNVSLTVSSGAGNDTKTITDFITVIPPEFNMQDGTITTCEGNFYDSGGPSGSYSNNENFTLTFYPSTSGSMVRTTFNTFDTETNYDYLYIYNGENTSAPLIGIYNGTTGPGTVTAANTAGALTFNFTSDVSVVNTGWSASISCYSATDPPVAEFSASTTTPTIGSDVLFTDQSLNIPSSWSWSFTPNNVVYINGTNANSQNPQVQFTDLGSYTVALAVSNAYGNDIETKVNYINVISCVYCDAGGTNGTEEWVSNVTFNTINNSSTAGSGYTDYTAISTDVDPGSVHNIAISCGSIGSWTENYWVFFDWNQDCDFDDAGESYDLGEQVGPGTLNTNVTVPLDATPGAVRMRVFIKFSSDPVDGCDDTYTYGEAEDYTVNVMGGDINLALTAMLEGPFDGIEMRTDVNSFLPFSQPFNMPPWNYNGSESVGSIPGGNVVEWVLIDLRDAASAGNATSATSIAKQAAFILNDGSIVDLDGSSNLLFPVSVSQNLYVVVWQRNHIGIMSNNAITPAGGIYNYDFTSGMNQVYGGVSGHKELAPGIWGMFSGDGDRNGTIGDGDKSSTWENQAGTAGYIFSDYNLDSESNNIDKDDYWVPNIGEGTQVPN